jgi:hypothetical protein
MSSVIDFRRVRAQRVAQQEALVKAALVRDAARNLLAFEFTGGTSEAFDKAVEAAWDAIDAVRELTSAS